MRFLLGAAILAMGVSGLAASAEARHGRHHGHHRHYLPPEPRTIPDSGTVRAGLPTASGG
jgi:hypothetical protein